MDGKTSTRDKLYSIASAIIEPVVNKTNQLKEKGEAIGEFCYYWDKARMIRNKENLERGDYKAYFSDMMDDMVDSLLFFLGLFEPVHMNQTKIEMIVELEERRQQLIKEAKEKQLQPERSHGKWQRNLHTSNRTKSFEILVSTAEAKKGHRQYKSENRYTTKIRFI